MKRFTVPLLLILLSGIIAISSADSISVKVNAFSYIFSVSGNLHSVIYEESRLSKPVRISSSDSDIISLTPEHHDSYLSETTPAYQIAENDSQSVISFRYIGESYTFVKQFCISKFTNTVTICCLTASGTDSTASTKIALNVALNKIQHEHYKFISIDNRNKKVFSLNKNSSQPITSSDWMGIRSRFTTILLRSDSDTLVLKHYNDSSIHFSGTISENDTLTCLVYAGPVKYSILRNIGNNAERLMFSLWFWMRWFSLGILYLFDFLTTLSGNLLIAIILLSICVKIILSPLFHIADKWQKKVNYQNNIIQPRIAEIKKHYKGEEQTRRIIALHKEIGISPLYSLKSLLSAAIQIPIFFAAYHALSEHYALFQSSAGFIADLSQADGLLPLPVTLPVLGNAINILPFVMTSITFASSWLHTDTSMSAVMLKKQRTNLYGMALLFFVLLYTSPAGMVIYWTMNNLLAFLSTVFSSFLHHRHQQIHKRN
ncbi:MAG: membrane protein insertase YidC [Fibrobacter sp.]|nr:membrane protein insertase YidC [Fibrobacter sp.]